MSSMLNSLRYPFMHTYLQRLIRICMAVVFVIGLASNASANTLLKCIVSYAGTEEVITTSPQTDPYLTESVDIGGRFKFKAVMIGKENAIDYIKLYAYFQTKRNDVPIHQASYFPPFQLTEKNTILTPKNYLYAGDVERALEYQCNLQKVTP